ncbi:MAG: formimidoylglutamate deiminase [Casimicrobium sp.]
MKTLWTPHAWLPTNVHGAWQSDVLFTVDDAGRWSNIEHGVSRTDAQARGAEILEGAAIAPLVNAHSHAFQRAFVGFAERRESAEDDFWSWRDRMYRVALTISPEQLKAVAKHLYIECLRGGYTHVCEFHYLHHSPSGKPYDDPYAMSIALIEAANDVGIGITLLPVVYERAGFDQPTLRDDQRRFRADAAWVLNAQRALAGFAEMYGTDRVLIGAALHSLRAASEASVATILNEASGPIHIHIAEQRAEVEACLATTGLRPIEYLSRQLTGRSSNSNGPQLVHGTHSKIEEIKRIAQSNGALVICLTTEANLGDGVTDVAAWLDWGVPITIGSDSHVCRDWREELRLLEYGQRLTRERRNVLAAPERGVASTAERIYCAAISGSANAAGLDRWGFTIGARADLLVIDRDDSSLIGVPIERLLDAMVFSSPVKPFADVMVAGEWVVRGALHSADESTRADFAAMLAGAT